MRWLRFANALRATFAINTLSDMFPATSPKPGVYRSIRVVARAAGNGKLTVRTRSGYIAGEAVK